MTPSHYTSQNHDGDRRFQAAQALDERYGISRTDLRLQRLAQQSGIQSPLGQHVRATYSAIIEQHAARLRVFPFLSPPPSISTGEFHLGDADGIPFRTTPEELLRHILIAGPSGSGKTTFLQHRALQVRAQGVHVIALEFKPDLQQHAATDDDYVIIHPDMPFNILEHDPSIGRASFIDLVVQLLARSYYGGEHLRQVGQESLEQAYERFGTPSVADWMQIAKSLISPKDTYQRRDAYTGLVHRLQRLIAQFPGMMTTRHGIPPQVLGNRSIYLGAPHHNDTYDFLGALLVFLVHQAAVAQQDRNTLRRLLVLDEGLLSFGATSRIDGPVLLPLIPLLREHGTAVAISTAHLGGIHETLRANAYTTVVLPLTNATDASLAARTLGLGAAQVEYLLRLTVGQAIVRTGKCETPFVITFPPATMDKTVDDTAWQQAITRTNQLAPANTTSTPQTSYAPPTTATTLHATPPKPQVLSFNTTPPASVPNVPTPAIPATKPGSVIASNTPQPNPVISSNTPPATTAVIASNTPPPVAPAPVLPVTLSTAEQALLHAIAQLVITTSVVAYRAASLTLQAGDRAAKHCESLGLLTREPITARQGRGGSAIALQLTTAGYSRLDKKPPHGLRAGSGAQHHYLVVTLAKLVRDARIEATLGGQGGKSIDVLLRLTPTHDRLTQVLTATATCLATIRAPLVPGELVAIEIETTADTVVNNIHKNLAAGVAHNITAVMPRAYDAAKKHLLNMPSELLPRVLLVNVFDLIEGLQEHNP
jgi:hypothetical protein